MLALILLPAGTGRADTPAAEPSPRERPRVALALSGGGARGIAHIGVLRALEEGGIPVDAVAANSMGAVVGGIFATGRSAGDLEQAVRSMDWASLFSGRPDRRTLPVGRRIDRYGPTGGIGFDWKRIRLPGGILAEHRVNRFLIQQLAPAGYTAGGDFDRLAIPFRAIAGDLKTGEPVVLAQGDLPRAVRASMSIPLAFPPVEWEGRLLVDGLIVNNLPIDVARGFEPLVLVAVDVSSPPREEGDYESAIDVASQVSDLLMRRRYGDFAADADVLIRPDLGRHSATDYAEFDRLIAAGYEATRAALPEIRRKLEAAGVVQLEPRARTTEGPSLERSAIASVRFEGTRRVSERVARRLFNVPIGPAFDMEKGLRALDKLDASTLFERTWIRFQPAGEGVDLVLQVKEAPANRAEVGIGYTEWEKARGAIRLRNQNTFGFGEEVELLLAASDAEQRVELSLRGERLIFPGLGHRVVTYSNRDRPRFFTADGEVINRARFSREGVDAGLRASLKRWGLVEAGVRFGHVKAQARAGLDLVTRTDQVGALVGRLTVDSLDDREWPEHGQRVAVAGEWSLADLGADREYWRLEVDACAARPFGTRLVAQVDGFSGWSGQDLPVYDWYRLGGPTYVPGYAHEELKGRQAIAGALSLRLRVIGQLRAVVRAGAGNVFDRTSDVSLSDLRWGLGVGAYHPSPIGPVSIELGTRDGGGLRTSLRVGWN